MVDRNSDQSWENHLYGERRANAPQPPDDITELRRQQAAFGDLRRRLDRQNQWLAAPALAPVAAVAGLEAGAMAAARILGPALRAPPHILVAREPYLRVGDNWATRAGRRAHNALKARLEQKASGWRYEPDIPTKYGLRKPDVGAPVRKPSEDNPLRRYLLELKPDTPTGRIAARRAVKRYERETENKTRAIFYNPKDFI